MKTTSGSARRSSSLSRTRAGRSTRPSSGEVAIDLFAAQRARRRADRHHAARHRRLRAVPHAAQDERRADRDGHGRATTPTTSSPGSRPGPTTTSPSRSPRRSCRRASAPCCAASGPSSQSHARLVFGDLELIPEEGKVLRSGEEVHLTKTEFRLLCELAENPGKVFSREALLDKVWGYDYFGDGRLVDVHVRRLRTKVEADAGEPASRRDRARPRVPSPDVTVPAALVSGDESPPRPGAARDLLVADLPPARSAAALGARPAAPHPADLHARIDDAVDVPRVHDLRLHPLERGPAARPQQRSTRPGSTRRRCRRCSAGNPLSTRAAIAALEGFGVQRGIIWYKDASSGGVATVRLRPTHPAGTPRPGDERLGAGPDDGARRRRADHRRRLATPRVTTRLLRVLQPRRGQQHAREHPALAVVRRDHHHRLRGAARRRSPPRRAVRPVRRRRPGGQGDRRWASRHPARTDRRPRPQRARQLVQRHGSRPCRLRIERDARFASDVSHELRSPLMTLAASIEVMEGRRDEMPERAQAALDLLRERRDTVPGARRRPARDQSLRCRRDPTAPRGAARRRVRPSTRSRSAAFPTRPSP